MPGPTVDSFPRPKSITGGCLCGLIRYRVDFPEDHDFLQSNGSCQCTQCRRNTGSLFFMSHTVPLDSLTYLTPTDSLKNFVATPGYQRGSCDHCASFLYWQDASRDDLELAVGCVDPDFLVGDEGEGEGGSGGFGFALANASGPNVWCQNEIPGVTDGMIGKGRGTKWAKSSEDGIKM